MLDGTQNNTRGSERAPGNFSWEQFARELCEDQAVAFLDGLGPPPWVLTAISPDKNPRTKKPDIDTITAKDNDRARRFIRQYEGKRNLYFSVNPARTAMTSKPAKTDIARVDFLHLDCDPLPGEASEDAKRRYLDKLNELEQAVTFAIDSGNGIQFLLRLNEPIVLPKPSVQLFDKKRRLKGLGYDDATLAIIADVEGRSEALMRALGAEVGTQNIDRILRIPGTTNLPNEKKRREGREECSATLLWFNDEASFNLEDFPLPQREQPKAGDGGEQPKDWTFIEASLPAELLKLVKDGVPDSEDRSRVFHHAVGWLKDLGWPVEDIFELLNRYPTGIARKYVEDQDDRLRLKKNVEDSFRNTAPPTPPPLDDAPRFSDEDLALRFANEHAHRLRYVAEWNKWVQWDGVRWQFDKDLSTFSLVRKLCRAVAKTCTNAKTANEIASAKQVAAVVSLARSDRRIAARVDQWDTDIMLLNTPGGVVDLRTGEMRDHRPEDYMTKCTSVTPGGECPRYDKFMDEITGGDV
jgi:hypothetical protein